MKTHLSVIAAASCLAAPALHAQWKTETYTLRGGWNAIYLHGDATHITPTELFKNYPSVLEVWRWNPNPDQIRFTGSPSDPSTTSSEWTIWIRDNPDEQRLTALMGQSAYLVRCSGAATTVTNVAIPQKPLPPSATWLITGANLMGFPANSASPLFSTYFASFPTAIASPAKIYDYIGGDLGSSNPMQISAASSRLNRNTAYWFEASTVGNFTAPVEYELPGTSGVAFGRTGSVITMGIMNRSTNDITLTLSPLSSEAAPTGQQSIKSSVPLTRRVLDSETGGYTETPIAAAFTVSVPASGRVNLELGIDRSAMTGSAGDLFASLLRITDSAGLSDVVLPVSAQISSPAGLWIGQVDVSGVVSHVAGSPGDSTARSYPLRVNMHVDSEGVARLLSQAYVGKLSTAGNPLGICIQESSLLPDMKSEALRVVSSQMPLDRAIAGSGTFAVGATLAHTINIPFDDPTNPFVHAYHPDHDNRDARMARLPAGVESYNITRAVSFTFTSSPPDGSSITGWGSSIYGGIYQEKIHGINKTPLEVSGTFKFRRISEIAEITLH